MCTPPPSAEPPTTFSNRGRGLRGSQYLEEVAEKERVQFLHKNKLKSKICNNKKVYKQKCFSLSLLIIQTGKLQENLVTFKRWHGFKDKGVH